MAFDRPAPNSASTITEPRSGVEAGQWFCLERAFGSRNRRIRARLRIAERPDARPRAPASCSSLRHDVAVAAIVSGAAKHMHPRCCRDSVRARRLPPPRLRGASDPCRRMARPRSSAGRLRPFPKASTAHASAVRRPVGHDRCGSTNRHEMRKARRTHKRAFAFSVRSKFAHKIGNLLALYTARFPGTLSPCARKQRFPEGKRRPKSNFCPAGSFGATLLLSRRIGTVRATCCASGAKRPSSRYWRPQTT